MHRAHSPQPVQALAVKERGIAGFFYRKQLSSFASEFFKRAPRGVVLPLMSRLLSQPLSLAATGALSILVLYPLEAMSVRSWCTTRSKERANDEQPAQGPAYYSSQLACTYRGVTVFVFSVVLQRVSSAAVQALLVRLLGPVDYDRRQGRVRSWAMTMVEAGSWLVSNALVYPLHTVRKAMVVGDIPFSSALNRVLDVTRLLDSEPGTGIDRFAFQRLYSGFGFFVLAALTRSCAKWTVSRFSIIPTTTD